jgi:2-polyprenyl-3-methyl-5-hydroxy-6-metoxy-1,4-benzoquinol methylase
MANILGVKTFDNKYLILPNHRYPATSAELLEHWLYEYSRTRNLIKYRLRQLNVPYNIHPFLQGRYPTVIFHPFEQMSFEVTETVVNEVFEPHERVDLAIAELFTVSSDKDPAFSYAASYYDALRAMQGRLSFPVEDDNTEYDHLWSFSQTYERIMTNLVGDSVMDVGTSIGVLPILIKERFPWKMVVGCDISNRSIEIASRLALTNNVSVDFRLADVTDHGFAQVGVFDTVTAVHLLEHFSKQIGASVMDNLCAITRWRLIVCVPFECGPTPWIVGHQRIFNISELAALGSRYGANWRLQSSPGGGILIIDRHEKGLGQKVQR